MSKTFKQCDFFETLAMRGKDIVIYNDVDGAYCYVEGVPQRFNLPRGSMALFKQELKSRDIDDILQGFDFGTQQLKLEGKIEIFQEDSLYLLMAIMPIFSQHGVDSGYDFQPIVLKIGDALEDI